MKSLKHNLDSVKFLTAKILDQGNIMVIMKLLPDLKIAYLTKKLNACVGIFQNYSSLRDVMADIGSLSQLITGGGATIPQKNSCKGNFILGARGFSCAVSGFGQVLKSGFAARVFCQRPKTCRPAADEAPRHTREKHLVPRVGKLVFKKNPARGDT